MDRPTAIDLLPEAYADALRLHDAGLADAIPERLGVPPEAVGPLLRLAEAKLAAVLSGGSQGESRGRGDQGGHPGGVP